MKKWVLFLLVVFSTASGITLAEPLSREKAAHEKTAENSDLTGEDEDDSRPVPLVQASHVQYVSPGPHPDCKPSPLTHRSQDVFGPPPEQSRIF